MSAGSAAALALCLVACASAPDGVPGPRLTQQTTLGARVEVEVDHAFELRGELISARDELYVLTQRGLVQVPAGRVTRVELWAYDGEDGSFTVWTLLGIASTISHGFWLIFTMPVWLISGSITAGAESRAGLWNDPSRDTLMAWSRFPQGIPDALLARAITPEGRPVRPGWIPPAPPVTPGPAPTPTPAPAPAAAEDDFSFEFASGGAHHPSGYGEWIVRAQPGAIALLHDVKGKVTDHGSFRLDAADEAALREHVARAGVAALTSSTRAGVRDEVQYTLSLTSGGATTRATVWINDAKQNPALVELVKLLARLIEQKTGEKAVLN